MAITLSRRLQIVAIEKTIDLHARYPIPYIKIIVLQAILWTRAWFIALAHEIK